MELIILFEHKIYQGHRKQPRKNIGQEPYNKIVQNVWPTYANICQYTNMVFNYFFFTNLDGFLKIFCGELHFCLIFNF